MERRRFLAALVAGAAGGLAGCSTLRDGGQTATPVDVPATARSGGTDPGTPTDSAAGSAESGVGSATAGTASSPAGREPLGALGTPAAICSERVKDDPGIYAITDPAFAGDWQGATVDPKYRLDGRGGLADEQTVVGLGEGSSARAYPISVLWYHEVVNDTLGSGDGPGPVLVTYCPLCRSGMVASRTLAGMDSPTTFRVSGLLWTPPGIQTAIAEEEGRAFGATRRGGQRVPVRRSGNLVLVDEATGSYWSQLIARGICGPRDRERLELVPSTVTTWTEWRTDNPATRVLLPPPASGTTG
ncbi:MAG: DUF3179 domain-containing (seleno)protein [Salinirussus sp.]